MIFTPDHDSGGWSIEIYADPDVDGSMEYFGRLDLFSRMLYIDGGRIWAIPTGYERTAIEAWATERIESGRR